MGIGNNILCARMRAHVGKENRQYCRSDLHDDRHLVGVHPVILHDRPCRSTTDLGVTGAAAQRHQHSPLSLRCQDLRTAPWTWRKQAAQNEHQNSGLPLSPVSTSRVDGPSTRPVNSAKSR